MLLKQMVEFRRALTRLYTCCGTLGRSGTYKKPPAIAFLLDVGCPSASSFDTEEPLAGAWGTHEKTRTAAYLNRTWVPIQSRLIHIFNVFEITTIQYDRFVSDYSLILRPAPTSSASCRTPLQVYRFLICGISSIF